MAGGRASFEVMTLTDGRWILSEIRETESAAQALAKKLFGNAACSGVRITKIWTRTDGSETESVIHEETRTRAEKPVQIVPIDEPPPVCRKSRDFYEVNARLTVNRLLKNYVEKVYLTPVEIMHNWRELKRFQEADMLMPQAVDRVASLQCKLTGDDVKQRKDEIFTAIAQIGRRARKAEEHPNLPRVKDDLDKVIARIERFAAPEEVDHLCMVALCRDLSGYRNWMGKIERMTGLVTPDLRPAGLVMVDKVTADLLSVPSALKDVLGNQRNLGSALQAMLDMSEGKFPVPDGDLAPCLETLNALFRGEGFTDSKFALMDGVLRNLKGGQPLSRNNPQAEAEEARLVVKRLLGPTGLLGGPETAAALVQRFARMGEAGGAAGRRYGIASLVQSLPDATAKVVVLLQLAESSLVPEHMSDVEGNLRTLIGVHNLSDLIPPSLPPRERMARATAIYAALVSTTALSHEFRARLAGHVDELLARYLERDGIIQKLDHSEAHLRDRATRLVQFCGSGVLPPGGKAHSLARDRVLAHLRQPNFDLHFIEGLTSPAEMEKALRNFHSLLVRAGFRG